MWRLTAMGISWGQCQTVCWCLFNQKSVKCCWMSFDCAYKVKQMTVTVRILISIIDRSFRLRKPFFCRRQSVCHKSPLFIILDRWVAVTAFVSEAESRQFIPDTNIEQLLEEGDFKLIQRISTGHSLGGRSTRSRAALGCCELVGLKQTSYFINAQRSLQELILCG